MKNHAWLLLLSVLVLSGCIDRAQEDARLAKACVAGAKAFMDDEYELQIKSHEGTEDHTLGHGYREVRVTVLEHDGWAETENEYKCVFAEEISLLGMGYKVDIYQLKFHDKTYGKDGGSIIGTMDDFLKLGDAVHRSLGK